MAFFSKNDLMVDIDAYNLNYYEPYKSMPFAEAFLRYHSDNSEDQKKDMFVQSFGQGLISDGRIGLKLKAGLLLESIANKGIHDLTEEEKMALIEVFIEQF